MWRNFSFPCMTIVGKFKISPHVEKFQYNLWGFITIYAVLLLNLLFMLFCRKNFATIYALSCREKLSPKVHLCRKDDKYQVCGETVLNQKLQTMGLPRLKPTRQRLLRHFFHSSPCLLQCLPSTKGGNFRLTKIFLNLVRAFSVQIRLRLSKW